MNTNLTHLEEYSYCVSRQKDLPTFVKNSSKNSFSNFYSLLDKFNTEISNYPNINNGIFKKITTKIIVENPNYIRDIRKLIGISDKRLYLELSYIFNREGFFDENKYSLTKHDTEVIINTIKGTGKYKLTQDEKVCFINTIVNYFCENDLYNIVDTFINISNKNSIEYIFNSLINPKEQQQFLSKARGHGAEQEVAKILDVFKVNFIPDKLNNPSSNDLSVNLKTMDIMPNSKKDSHIKSIDIIVKKDGDIRILIPCLIHSSDPGQYGVDKFNSSVIAIRELIDKYNNNLANPNKKVFLWVCSDGEGFIENKKHYSKLLENVDMFFQMNTLFKIPLMLSKEKLISKLKGVYLDNKYFDHEMISHFKNTFKDETFIQEGSLDEYKNKYKCIKAGKAIIFFE